MEKLYSVHVSVGDYDKEIAVYCGDVTVFEDKIDILTTSAFVGSYEPAPRTVFRALYDRGISMENLAISPEFDLREPCNVWLSHEIQETSLEIGRIGCIELIGGYMREMEPSEKEQRMINSIRAYFHMLDIASVYGIKMSTVALPLLGGGDQNISAGLLLIPLLNECITLLKRNQAVDRIVFIEKNFEKASLIADSITQSFRFLNNGEIEKKKDKMAFISYSSPDKNIADNLCFKLESNGIKVWYAPRDVVGPYAAAIAEAIEKVTHFVVILSQNSISSEHVLNEIDLAFQKLPNDIKFKPLRIDTAMFTPSFKYYLSRQHWLDATNPPLEERLNEFVNDLVNDDM